LQRGEVSLSLRTRRFREAEHRAALVDDAFGAALARVSVDGNNLTAALGPILAAELRNALERDLRERMERPPGRPVYAHAWERGDRETATEADLRAIREARASMAQRIADNDPMETEDEAAMLLRRHGLPEALLRPLAMGLLEVAAKAWDAAERRTLGLEPLVLDAARAAIPDRPTVKSTTPENEGAPTPRTETEAGRAEAPSRDAAGAVGPLASSMVEPHFTRREAIDGTRHQVMAQERTTLRLFFEVCGDRPPADYQRGDVTRFLDTLRRMPTLYNRSRTAPPMAVADIIAEADAAGAPRLSDKTVKRHLTALAQFFRFAMDQGHISATARIELVADHRFQASKKARDQRDAWAPDDLVALFKTPVWSGRDASRATQPGPHIIRDAKFWLPILALFHGGRLEEFADLYGRDLQCDAGTWFLNIVETEADEAAGKKARSLKTGNATRALPLHPEVIRLGFVQYVRETATNPDDPLFPDLPPQGKDGRRGARFTRDFIYYRQQVGVYRKGVGMHSFRHTAITRLTDAITDFQQKRHRDYLMGHSGGSTEGDVRYDKGPGLKAAAATLALLTYPEVDLSHLHVPAPVPPLARDDTTE
jgi:integrase